MNNKMRQQFEKKIRDTSIDFHKSDIKLLLDCLQQKKAHLEIQTEQEFSIRQLQINNKLLDEKVELLQIKVYDKIQNIKKCLEIFLTDQVEELVCHLKKYADICSRLFRPAFILKVFDSYYLDEDKIFYIIEYEDFDFQSTICYNSQQIVCAAVKLIRQFISYNQYFSFLQQIQLFNQDQNLMMSFIEKSQQKAVMSNLEIIKSHVLDNLNVVEDYFEFYFEENFFAYYQQNQLKKCGFNIVCHRFDKEDEARQIYQKIQEAISMCNESKAIITPVIYSQIISNSQAAVVIRQNSVTFDIKIQDSIYKKLLDYFYSLEKGDQLASEQKINKINLFFDQLKSLNSQFEKENGISFKPMFLQGGQALQIDEIKIEQFMKLIDILKQSSFDLKLFDLKSGCRLKESVIFRNQKPGKKPTKILVEDKFVDDSILNNFPNYPINYIQLIKTQNEKKSPQQLSNSITIQNNRKFSNQSGDNQSLIKPLNQGIFSGQQNQSLFNNPSQPMFSSMINQNTKSVFNNQNEDNKSSIKPFNQNIFSDQKNVPLFINNKNSDQPLFSSVTNQNSSIFSNQNGNNQSFIKQSNDGIFSGQQNQSLFSNPSKSLFSSVTNQNTNSVFSNQNGDNKSTIQPSNQGVFSDQKNLSSFNNKNPDQPLFSSVTNQNSSIFSNQNGNNQNSIKPLNDEVFNCQQNESLFNNPSQRLFCPKTNQNDMLFNKQNQVSLFNGLNTQNQTTNQSQQMNQVIFSKQPIQPISLFQNQNQDNSAKFTLNSHVQNLNFTNILNDQEIYELEQIMKEQIGQYLNFINNQTQIDQILVNEIFTEIQKVTINTSSKKNQILLMTLNVQVPFLTKLTINQ
ncbi:hypothetical protein TTHERM_00125180 (macronuclear) [Tetrahymena thermophila SB210]|uniref:PID domain-containing protein n=1 Tax=Tetrahymena thermophila (strain SB210) TaxID=312017 RepID=I7M1A5_TETTS|nr:hypothetical protein TTHERM_00125180 [Tetrahymena thermophila SB210]EAR95952.2 hypothetical protein TTHERM_00125180 [Tetrahymena thermophila SB210]|eukprot:XP_001016197.2 hypothetical protein TTHERM_00125180 [Tetrahymena thermophila SB210]